MSNHGPKLKTSRGGSTARKHKAVPSFAGKPIQATQAKNRFGDILKIARDYGPVFIERHGQTQVVVLDITTYRQLIEARRTPDEKRLDALRHEFNELYTQMQSPQAQTVADRFLSAPAEELNQIARGRR